MNFKILGAGPAGLSSAIALAKEGYKVDVFEKTSQLGGHIGTDIQAIRNYGTDFNILEKFKKYGINISKYNEINKIVKYSPSYRKDTIYSKKEPLFYNIKRGIEKDSLENQLGNIAKKQGVEINLGKKNTPKNCHIIANGSKFKPVGMIYGGVFESNFEKKTITFFLGNKYTQSGYAYIAPYTKKRATIAIISFNPTEFNNLKKRFNEFIKTDKIVSKIVTESELVTEYGGYGHYNIPETAIYKHKYLVGGAAGFVDPARGFGLKYAILSGALAAKAITSKQSYDKLWKKEFKQELIDGFNRANLLKNINLKDYEKFISGKNISSKDYHKIPNSFKTFFMNLNGALALNKWQQKFDYRKSFDF